MQEFESVRVSKLLTPTREITGTESVTRQPVVGDLGTIVHVDSAGYWVESIAPDLRTIWLACFDESEIEVVRGG
jgi:hypothetical protein